MQLAPAGVPLSFEVTFDRDDLDVAMSVYDDSGSVPVLLLSPFAMVLVTGYTYRGKFTAVDGKNYIIIKAVYTDDTFTEFDDNYSQGSESIVAQTILGNNDGLNCNIVGQVIPDTEVVGSVDC